MIGSLMMCVSVAVLLAGMLAGIVMGIQQDFELAPAHAHFNLIGGVLLFLFGLYYRLVPAAGFSKDHISTRRVGPASLCAPTNVRAIPL